jgi:type I restriction enzyme S subunit
MVKIRMFRPPLEAQKEFSTRRLACEKQKSRLQTSLARMDTLFESLQHRAFRGEL